MSHSQTDPRGSIKRPLLATALLTTAMCLALLLACLPFGRWWELQRLGEVPKGANLSTSGGIRDWRIAAHTTWWGKQLDPEKFWKNRPIWNDASAASAAQRHGRGYPPIPTHLTNLVPPFSIRASRYKDIVASLTGPDSGPYIPYHFSDAENAYWDWFGRTHPTPPELLETQQSVLAWRIFSARKPLIVQGKEVRGRSIQERVDSEAHEKRVLQEMGIPPEALTEEALFWAYVFNKRQAYEKIPNTGWSTDSVSATNLLGHLGVDPAYITGPLTTNQLQAAKAWKIAYLQRLRRERTDESYINAYLKAWNLSPTKVYHEDQQQ